MNQWHTFEDLTEAERLGAKLLGAGIRSARLRAGVSQTQLAWQVGLSQAAISRLETGQSRGMRLRTLTRIAGALRIGPNWLADGGPAPPTRRMPGQRSTNA